MTVPANFARWMSNHCEDIMEHAQDMQREAERWLPGQDEEGTQAEAELRKQLRSLELLARKIRRTAKKLPVGA